ncbi:hypothetical protein [Pseudobacteroides cellulosolvens]|uniref:Uncharacterized protein n=1 Tax=Pseudobacteroides cellulosolvens ATCC 35603 = DSM 2933 TaxID=398512 RepID=A0A0L6JYJ3_9FIRM|nr:hypothetical protein [Pseudobacteroides cellulosolvens]KNY30532.1 hypothetical protein Bccel_5812 [Pseudobacteroides cellulosolvens ATCC 35603 = DSM 2933]KNY30539.1 hypothetical protein Bccel_5819 [Pseudobacteroides cellulosolvens ATCC 35603 = DSM 2933]
MLDINNGDLKLLTNTTINKSFTEQKLKSDNIINMVQRTYAINGWNYYTFKLININGLDLMLKLTFKDDVLEFCSLKHYGSFEEIPFDTDNEIKRLQIHNQWLENMLGKPSEGGEWRVQYNFKWGEVSSGYSPQTPESAIYIKWI